MRVEPRSLPLPEGARQAGGRGRADRVVVAAPAVLALGLCLYGITSRSLGFDEAASVAIASEHGSALAGAIAHDGGNMSAYYVLLHELIALFGHGALVIRAPSALAGAATVALTAHLGLRLFDRRGALIAGLVTAVSLPLVFWGQSARGYAPMLALATGSFVAFLALVRPDRQASERPPGGTEPSERPSRAAWVAYVLCTTLAVYMGFVAVLIVLAQLVSLLWLRHGWRRIGSALVVAALCWAPLLVLAISRGSGQLFWVPRPSLAGEKQVLELVTSAGLEPSFHRIALTFVVLAAILLAVGFAALRGRLDFRRALLLSWLLVPLLLAWLESLVGQPIFLPRNLITVLPAVGLLVALAATDRRLPHRAVLSLVALLLVLRAVPLALSYGVSPEDWRSTTAAVLRQASPGDCIAFYPSDARMAFAYFVPPGTQPPHSVLPAAPWSSQQPYIEAYASLPAAELRRLPAVCPRLWLVSSHEGQASGPAGSRAHRARFQALRASLSTEYGRRKTSQFGYAATITVELFSQPVRSGSL